MLQVRWLRRLCPTEQGTYNACTYRDFETDVRFELVLQYRTSTYYAWKDVPIVTEEEAEGEDVERLATIARNQIGEA